MSPAVPDGSDALAHLAKMSGAGSAFGAEDYVAISSLSIVCLILGFASASCLMISLFLFIPVVGLFLGLIAIWKIRNSGGTQSGLGFAIGGMALCLLFGGGVSAKLAIAAAHTREESRQCGEVIAKFGEEIKAQHYDAMYESLMTDVFRERVSPKFFHDVVEGLRAHGPFGELKGTRWPGNIIDFEPVAGTDAKYAYATIVFEFSNAAQEPRETIKLTNREGSWKIEGLPQLFPEQKPGPAGK